MRRAVEVLLPLSHPRLTDRLKPWLQREAGAARLESSLEAISLPEVQGVPFHSRGCPPSHRHHTGQKETGGKRARGGRSLLAFLLFAFRSGGCSVGHDVGDQTRHVAIVAAIGRGAVWFHGGDLRFQTVSFGAERLDSSEGGHGGDHVVLFGDG